FISIQFSPTNTYDDWLLVLVFGQENHENHTFKLEDYFLDANFPIGFNASENHTFYKKLSEEDKPVWSAKEKKGFSCSSALITLADRFDYKATVQFNNLRVIAFARLDSDKFHQEQDFVSCESSLVVPIIIGILLLLTAILAIFGFFIGRRCKNAAYEQVE
uniref:Uncharacterized protein n=1 Tax=Acrobeloides nanus TaxID=290746 RepID=A0A914DAI1_9BILA